MTDIIMDFLNNNDDTGGKKRKQSQFDTGLAGVSRSQTVQATAEKKLVNGRFRKTIYVTPEADTYISEIAQNEGVGLMDLYEWLISIGLSEYDDGKRPRKLEQATIRQAVKPEHWTGG